MQRDFHYYTIFVLSRMAGFNPTDSKIIAYSSQFVDDSTDSKPIWIKDGKEKIYRFDTVRTAHNGIQFFKWDVQKKIYFPFHFIPEQPLKKNQSFSYLTKPNSPFAQKLVDEAFSDQSDLRLYRIGVALHTFADTWAHANFSGRNHRENDIKKLCRCNNGDYKRCAKIPNFLSDLLRRKVGHVQGARYPDIPSIKIRYLNYQDNVQERYNWEHFLDASENIFKKLVQINYVKDPDAIWSEEKKTIKSLLQGEEDHNEKDIATRCKSWMKTYNHLFKNGYDPDNLRYDPVEWRTEAIRFADSGDIANFLDTHWAKFQQAALKQRYLVLEGMMGLI